jgi:hypothetical protein
VTLTRTFGDQHRRGSLCFGVVHIKAATWYNGGGSVGEIDISGSHALDWSLSFGFVCAVPSEMNSSPLKFTLFCLLEVYRVDMFYCTTFSSLG